MSFGRAHSHRYLVLLVLAVSTLQFALLAEIRQEPPKEPSRQLLDIEAEQSFSPLVDLIADSRGGLHASYDAGPIVAIDAPRLDESDGTATSMVFAQDQALENIIDHYSQYYGVDPVLVAMIIERESAYDPFALSATGAMGLVQLMPDTAWMLGVDDPWDAEENIEGGVRYFSEQMARFGSVELALAAYNAGPGAVEQWGGIPPYPETIEYVQYILGRYEAELQKVEYDEIPEQGLD